MLTRSQIITAIVTPFTAEGQIDYPALEKLTEYLLQSGTQGFVVGGTTGETDFDTSRKTNALPKICANSCWACPSDRWLWH